MNNAGYAVYQTFEELDRRDRAPDPGELLRRLLRHARVLASMEAAGRGHVVMMASIAGRLPMTPCGIYSAAEARHGRAGRNAAARKSNRTARCTWSVPDASRPTSSSTTTFVARAPRPEAQRSVPVEYVAAATIDAVTRAAF